MEGYISSTRKRGKEMEILVVISLYLLDLLSPVFLTVSLLYRLVSHYYYYHLLIIIIRLCVPVFDLLLLSLCLVCVALSSPCPPCLPPFPSSIIYFPISYLPVYPSPHPRLPSYLPCFPILATYLLPSPCLLISSPLP